MLSLFFLSEVHNRTEPCGCTTNPLGDVARVAYLVKQAGPSALLLDAGGLRYGLEAIPEDHMQEARMKADFLEQTWASLSAVVGLKPEDLRGGRAESAGLRRVATNLLIKDPGPRWRDRELRTIAGVTIGVVSVASPEAVWPAWVTVLDPMASIPAAVKALREEGADLVVALTGLGRPAARRLARGLKGLDVVVAGDGLDLGIADPEQVGEALLVVPAKEAQAIVRMDLYLAGGKPRLRWLRSADGQRREAARLGERLAAMREQLADLNRDPAADPAFVRATREEIAQIEAALARLRQPAGPSDGHVTVELLPIHRGLPRDPEVAAALARLDRRIGEENLLRSGPPERPLPGQPGYLGLAGCQGSCHFHDEAFVFWKERTLHARAWQTLVEVKKELSYECVRCHATGFDQLGGSTLRTLVEHDSRRDLRNVQCEACHGPGSLHAAAPSRNKIPVAFPQRERCLECHPKEHSDTFDFVPYLRDILGPGHGEERRARLGPGPTGAELRRRARESGPAPPALP